MADLRAAVMAVAVLAAVATVVVVVVVVVVGSASEAGLVRPRQGAVVVGRV